MDKNVNELMFDYAENDIWKLLEDIERLDLEIRGLFSLRTDDLLWDLDRASQAKLKEELTRMQKDAGKKGIVTVEMDDGALILHTPVTLKREARNSWFLSRLAAEAIRSYEKENGSIAQSIKKPVYIIVKRKALKNNYGYRDNENLETSKLINEIFRALGYPDNAKDAGYVSLYSIVDNKEDTGTDFIIFNRNDLPEKWKYFSF